MNKQLSGINFGILEKGLRKPNHCKQKKRKSLMLKLDFNIHDPTLQNLAKEDPFIAATVLHNPLGEYSV